MIALAKSMLYVKPLPEMGTRRVRGSSGQRNREGMRRRSFDAKPCRKSGDLYTFHCLGNRLINRLDIEGCMVAPSSVTTFAGVTCFWISRAGPLSGGWMNATKCIRTLEL